MLSALHATATPSGTKPKMRLVRYTGLLARIREADGMQDLKYCRCDACSCAEPLASRFATVIGLDRPVPL